MNGLKLSPHVSKEKTQLNGLSSWLCGLKVKQNYVILFRK